MTILRLSRIALVAAIAFFFTLVAFNNITDYDSNWEFVQPRPVDGHDVPGFQPALAGDHRPQAPARGLRHDHHLGRR